MKIYRIITVLLIGMLLISAIGCKTSREFDLSTVIIGAGSVSPDEGSFPSGEDVEIEAIPDEGWVFDHWGGDASGTDDTIVVKMNEDKTVRAYFAEMPAPTPTPTPSVLGCTLETARALVAQTADIESMKCDVIFSFGGQSFNITTWQKGDNLVRMEVNGSFPEWPEGQVWLVNMSSSCGGNYYYFPAENRAELADSSISPDGFVNPLIMGYWLASPDAHLENCSFSCETYNGTECLAIQFPPDFDNVKLWLEMSSGLVIHLQMEDEEAGLITYDYSNIDLSDIPDSMFQLPEGTTITGEDHACSWSYDFSKDDIQNAVVWYASENLGAFPILTGTYTNAECSVCSIVNMSALIDGGIFSGIPDGLWQGAGPSDDNCDASGGSISGCSASNHYIWIIDSVGNVLSYCQGAECTSTNSGYQGVWP